MRLRKATYLGDDLHSVEEDLWWKTTFGERRPLAEDNLWWKMTFIGRLPQKICEPNFFRHKILFGHKYFSRHKFFQTKIFFLTQIFYSDIKICLNKKKLSKFFSTKNLYWIQMFSQTQNLLWTPNLSWTQNVFGLQAQLSQNLTQAEHF